MTIQIDTIIERVIAIITKKNIDDSWGLKSIKYGEPDYEIYDDPPPFAFIKLARDFQTTENKIGSSNNSKDSKIFHLEIGVIGFGKNISEAQKIHLPILEKIKTALNENKTLKNPKSDDSPIAIRINFDRISRLESKQGQEISGSVISLQIHVGDSIVISISNVTNLQDISVISAPISRNTETNIPYYNTKRELKGYAPIGGVQTKYFEIEHTDVIEEKLDTLKKLRSEFTLSVKRKTSKTYNVRIGNIGISERSFDQLTIIIIQFDVIP